jgi:hypothetical protein
MTSVNYRITALCGGGHVQSILVSGELGRVFADEQAGILDGTSRFYVIPPGPDSFIEKCASCGRPFRCSVTEEPAIVGAN